VHLKSLTLRGFKSFASATTLQFEPGITCVVGPNGSGKSNVVDALAWVLGEQGAKSLRGGKMDDVIFAGTAGRPPLGRAEVSVTIDNADGALPIDYAEVTISRIMFRTGGSDYAINGSPCRLLDVQELLSDSGIGREMHVIVGQGQLDAVLHAAPEDRRAFIEEAAGVLKHRKRKEKALRKLDAMQADLNRLADLTGELRRQLKPLGRQAEVARRAAVIQAEVRDARLRLLAADLAELRSTVDAEIADERALLARRAEVETELAAARDRETALESAAQAQAPLLVQAQETVYRLGELRERLRGLVALAAERRRQVEGAHADPTPHRDPESLEAAAQRVREELTERFHRLEADRAALQQVSARRSELEQALAAADADLAVARRAIADRREGLATLSGQVAALRSRGEAADDEIGRLAHAHEAAAQRADEARRTFTELESQVAGLDAGEVDLDAEYDQVSSALDRADEQLAALLADERDVERRRSAAVARRDTLALGLTRKDGHGALLAARDRAPGLLGSIAEIVQVEPGWEVAVAAALGSAADAVAVAGLSDAAAALELLRADQAGRAGLVIGGASYPTGHWPSLPPGSRYAIDAVTAPESLRPALTRLLDRVALAADLAAAHRLVSDVPEVRCVTVAGDLLGPAWASGGGDSAPSLLEVRAAYDDAVADVDGLTRDTERLRFAVVAAREARNAAQSEVDAAVGRLHESDARMSAVAERLGQLGAAARAAADEAERLAEAVEAARGARDRDLAGLAALEERLAAAATMPLDAEPDPGVRDGLAENLAVIRSAEVEARLSVRSGEEQVAALDARADGLERAAAAEREAVQRSARDRARRLQEAEVAHDVLAVAEPALVRLQASIDAAAAGRGDLEQARTLGQAELIAVREQVRGLDSALDDLTGAAHRDEVARAEQRLRIEALEAKAAEAGVTPEVLVAEWGPDQLVPPAADAPDDEQAVPFVREEQDKRLRTAERALALLGTVNPLALEEFAALEERHKFLSDSLEDLKASRRDLLTVVREVDARVESIFAAAYSDVATEFEKVFATLFPGGAGRLVLTDPDDLLSTGIDVEARPPGKKVKRLSLLSGGERSLTAVAFLVAIFRARPSPFYVLDEVEAALDDRNLARLVELLAELKATSQLIVITHQKRTMEVADALYGVSMRGDGITQVISQRLRDAQPA
jgi:chromosome segregation protein